MFVKPAKGVKVRDPVSLLHIPESGAEYPVSSWLLRKLKSGDMVACTTPSPVVEKSQITEHQVKKAKE